MAALWYNGAVSQPPLRPIPSPDQGPPKPRGETRTCDACGRVTFCVTIPLHHGAASGSLCIACLGRSLRGLQADDR